MPQQLYNTKTRKKEDFIPIEDNHVRIYTCGPTVYDTAHVGNFRTFIFEDLLKRFLLFKGFRVTHIMNLTDVDDKTIKKAITSGVPIRELTDRYIAAFFNDSKILKINPADEYPRATDHVAEMIAMIQKLLDNGNAYKTDDGSIFFSIASYNDYGKLARLDIDQQQSTERVDSDDYSKDNPQDFTLWKAWKEEDHSVYWDSPWGRGRPGWHIECSAMSTKYLGNHFDIHCGGVDNLFPHHENELAQSVCSTKADFVNYWMHCEHLLVDSSKMSKSLDNFYRLEELLEKGFTEESLRYVLLTTHYRSKLNFSLDKRHESLKAVKRIQDIFDRLTDFTAGQEAKSGNIAAITELSAFEKFLDNDLDIAGGIGVLFEWIRATNAKLDQGRLSVKSAFEGLSFLQRINEILDVLTDSKETIPADIQLLVTARDTARSNKDWPESDRIRTELQSLGWKVEDTPEGCKVRKA